MILHGNQRGGVKNLALRLLKTENDHVEIHELRRFHDYPLCRSLLEVYWKFVRVFKEQKSRMQP